jgi:NAD(P)H-hydrate epimerase
LLRRLVPPSLADDAHKGDAGKIFGLCGSRTMPGAAVLVARAAQRAGAGLVTLGCLEPELLRVVPAAVPEAVYVDLSALDQWPIFLASRGDHALVVGPGLGQGPSAAAALDGLLACGRRGPLVLDADALTMLASQRGGLARLNAATILTPHPGEAQRLLGRSVGSDPEQRREAALELARASGAVVVLKGRHSVVAQGSQVYVNDTGNWGMATAGSGDVLSGIAAAYAALCATGQHPSWTPFDAAAAAVRVHGLAGDLAAAHLGRRALIASDLIGYLPAAQKRLEAAAT